MCGADIGAWAFMSRSGRGVPPQQNRAEKEQRVREGRTHAALVFEGDDCLGWCQFGSPAELPEIKSKRKYEKELVVLPAGASPDSSPERACASAVSRTPLSAGRWLRSPGRAVARSRATPRRPTTVQCLARSCTPALWPRSRTTVSRDPADLTPPLGRDPHCRAGLRLHLVGGLSAQQASSAAPTLDLRNSCSMRRTALRQGSVRFAQSLVRQDIGHQSGQNTRPSN